MTNNWVVVESDLLIQKVENFWTKASPFPEACEVEEQGAAVAAALQSLQQEAAGLPHQVPRKP